MIDQDFCDRLEYALCKILKGLHNNDAKGFWCDGVTKYTQLNCYTKTFVTDNRYILLKVFAGKSGQDEYELILKFGPSALSRLEQELEILSCLPGEDYDKYFFIDAYNKKMILQME
jgi:hypothetical protein